MMRRATYFVLVTRAGSLNWYAIGPLAKAEAEQAAAQLREDIGNQSPREYFPWEAARVVSRSYIRNRFTRRIRAGKRLMMNREQCWFLDVGWLHDWQWKWVDAALEADELPHVGEYLPKLTSETDDAPTTAV